MFDTNGTEFPYKLLPTDGKVAKIRKQSSADLKLLTTDFENNKMWCISQCFFQNNARFINKSDNVIC